MLSVMLALFLGGLLSQRCAGHDSPDHEIAALTERLGRSVQGGARAELLWRRATEHRALFQLEAAGRDLEEALRYDPGLVRARHDLVRVQLAQGETTYLAPVSRIWSALRFPNWPVRKARISSMDTIPPPPPQQ